MPSYNLSLDTFKATSSVNKFYSFDWLLKLFLFYRDVDALNDYLHGDNSKTVSGFDCTSTKFTKHVFSSNVHLLEGLMTGAYFQIEEDDVTNAAYGSDGSFFANDTVSSA